MWSWSCINVYFCLMDLSPVEKHIEEIKALENKIAIHERALQNHIGSYSHFLIVSLFDWHL